MQGIFRKNTFGFFGPSHKTGVAAVKTILHSALHSLRFAGKSIKIEIKTLALLAIFLDSVFIDDRKCRASHRVLYTDHVADCMNDGGLPRSHFSMQCDN